jgi:putative ABC transport system permease protein
MRTHTIALRELRYRWLGALVILVGIIVCVAMITSIRRASLTSINEMRKAMLVMGQNIVILPRETTLDDYWAADFGDHTLPETDVRRVAQFISDKKVFARHFIGSLQRRITIDGKRVVLTGLMVEIDRKAPKVVTETAQKPIPKDSCELGAIAARRLGLREGDTLAGDVRYEGRALDLPPLTVIKVRPEEGTPEDFRVYVNIDLAQDLFDAPGKVNVIEAVSCICGQAQLPGLALALEKGLYEEGTETPRGKAFHMRAKAEARLKARLKNNRYVNLLTAAVFIFGAVLVGGYSVFNVQERRREMGVLLAIAARPRDVAWIVLLKMILLAVVGGLIGCWLGDVLATEYGAEVVEKLHPSMRGYMFRALGWQVYAIAVGWALALAMLPSLVGVVAAATTDPAETLRES